MTGIHFPNWYRAGRSSEDVNNGRRGIFNVILTSCLLVSRTAALNEQQTVRQLSRKRESGSVECGQKTGKTLALFEKCASLSDYHGYR